MKKNLLLGLLSILCIVYKITFSLSEEEQNIFSSNNYLIKNQSFLKLVKNSIECYSSQEVMEIALGCVFLQGFYLEMGVFKGATINFIASIKEQETIYGFDSFEGLPEAWSRDDTAMFAKGFFTIDTLPVVRDNVILVSGWFENSLPLFQKRLKDQVIAFMHIDCDIYSSTKTIFDVIGDHVVPGTILVFDELYNYQGFDRHEIKALYEFLERKNYSVEYLAYNVMHEQVAVMIVDSNNN